MPPPCQRVRISHRVYYISGGAATPTHRFCLRAQQHPSLCLFRRSRTPQSTQLHSTPSSSVLMRLPATILLRSPKGGGGGGGRGGSSSSKGSSSSSNKSGSSRSGSGSSSSGSTSGSRPVGGYYGGSGSHSGGGGGAKSKLPWWAIFLIVYFSLFFTVFLVALCYYCIKERRRKKEDNQPIRAGHAVWKAFCVASGLWLVIWLVKRCRGDRKGRKGLTRTGTYSKIQEGGGDDHGDGDRASGARAVGDDAAGPPAQARGGDAKYDEPLGYGQPQPQQQAMRYWPREQPVITGPVEQTSAIPMPSPTASPAPSIISARSAPPPPYTGPPASGLAPPPGPDVNKPLPQIHQADRVPRPAPTAAVPPSSLFGSSIESPAAAHNVYAQGGSYKAGYSGSQGGAY